MLQNRRQFIKKITAGTAAAITAPAFFACTNEDTRLTILHTNDVHSRIDPFPNDHYEFPNMGGFARRASLIQQIRKEQKHVLLLDAGDIFQGTPYFNFYKGRLELELMSKMGYDAATLGNHEFDNGMKDLAQQLNHAKFPFVSSNYDFTDTVMEGLTSPYQIFKKGRIKVGIFGLGIDLEGLASPANFVGMKFKDPLQTASEVCQHLKNTEKCNYIICLSHLGYSYKTDKLSDQHIAQNTKDLDLIIGGHTHTYLPEPQKLVNNHKQEVLINQVGWGGAYLGRIDVSFSSKNDKGAKHQNKVYNVG